MTLYRPGAALRAKRTYVHSTDLYANLIDGVRESLGLTPDGPLTLNLRHLIVREPVFAFAEGDDAAPIGAAAGDFAVTCGERVVRGWIHSDGEIVTARKPYDEGPIWERAVVGGDTITMNETPPSAPIEVITALGVLLLNTARPPVPGKKWLLGKLEIDRPLADGDRAPISIAILPRSMPAIVRLSIAAGSGLRGQMLFVLAAPAV